MSTVLELQQRLAAMGYPPGPIDGIWGKHTAAATFDALDSLKALRRAPAPPVTETDGIANIVNGQPKATRSINEIIIHCTATPEGKDYSVDTIRGWHKARGWSDIGYHWVVHLDGTVEAGRPEKRVGAHVANHNTGTLGVVYIGGVETDGKTPKDTRTPAQKAALMDLCRALIAKYPAIRKVTGHNDYTNAKACPSFKVGSDPLGSLV